MARATKAPEVEPEVTEPETVEEVVTDEVEAPEVEPDGRIETFDAVRPDGVVVVVVRNIDTGAQTVTEK